MLELNVNQDEMRGLLKEAIQDVVRETIQEVIQQANSIPPILDQKQLMELLNISRTKASELINRKDFPVCRELGHPRIVTSELFKWLSDNSHHNLSASKNLLKKAN